MKKLSALFALFFIVSGCTPIPVKPTPPIESVIDVPGRNKDQIYTATKSWIAENFRSAKSVIELDDRQTGQIIGNASIRWPCSGLACLGQTDWKLDFTMRVDTKDQKMKVTFMNLGLSWPPTSGAPSADHLPIREDQMADVRPALAKLQDELTASIKKEQTKADW